MARAWPRLAVLRAGWRRPAFGFALGLVLALGQPPLSLSYLGFAALIVLFALFERAETPRAAAELGWAAGAGFFLFSLSWIVEPFLIDPEQHAWMAPFAVTLLPGFLGLFWAASFGLAARLSAGWRRLFLAAALLALVETSRAYVLTGFPWALLGYLWIDSAQMQMAALIGPHGLTLLTTLAAAAGAAWIGRPRIWLIAPLVAGLALASAGLWGGLRAAEPLAPREAAIMIRVVQPNAEQSLKWNPEKAREFLRVLLAQTEAEPRGAEPDLFIWPETAVPYLLNGSEALLAEIDRAAGGRPVVFGIARSEGEIYYNSLAVTGPGGSVAAVYDKFHLVPGGEYIPFGEFLAEIGIRGMAVRDGAGFAPGPGPRLLDLGPFGKMLPLICYEAIFPQHLHLQERADWLLQVTNDAWFGEVLGPYQHLAQARMRAVEQGLPLVRSANTGVSAVIDAQGAVVASLGLSVGGFLDAELPPALPPTLYARSGDWPVLALLLVLSLMLASPRGRKSD